MSETGWVVGARVAVISGYSNDKDYREDVVAKVYKNGNVVLTRLGSGQWTPRGNTAHPAGKAHRWSTTSALLRTPETEAQIVDGLRATVLSRRWNDAVRRAVRVSSARLTEDAVAHLEAAVAALKPEPSK